MNILLSSIFIICFSLLPVLSHAAPSSYYVTQNGNGARNGRSLANAWNISDFNSAANWSATDSSNKIAPGDTVYFSGTITAEVVPKGGGSSGNVITFDGYEAGDCDPLNAVCSSSALLTGGFLLVAHDYINIYDFRMTKGRTKDYHCLTINNASNPDPSNYITIKRNFIYDAALGMFSSARTGAPYNGSDYLTVEENKMVGYGKSANPAQGINFVNNSNLVVRNNIFAGGGASNCTSDNVIEVHNTENAIFEYNDIYGAYNQAGIAIKEPRSPSNKNVIVRFNKIHHNGSITNEARGIYVGSNSSHVYIYGNFIYKNLGNGIDPNRGARFIHIWSNIIVNNGRFGIVTWTGGGYRATDNIYIYNNTIAFNNTTGTNENWTGITFQDRGTNRYVKNNLLYNNRTLAKTNYHQVYFKYDAIGDIDLEHNTYHYDNRKYPTINSDAAYTSLATMQGSYNIEDDFPAGKVADPGFTDPNGADNIAGTVDDDYTLDGTIIDDGADLSKCFNVTVQGTLYTICYDDALDPNNTDWTTTPPTIHTTKQEDYGFWDRGAYVYTGRESTIKRPTGLLILH